jgi:DNA modification methylase
MMANHHDIDNRFDGPISPSYNLFKDMQYIIENDDENDNNDPETLDYDFKKMRCHMVNCLVALHRVQKVTRKLIIDNGDKEYESAKSRIFNSAISMINGELVDDSDQIFKSLL